MARRRRSYTTEFKTDAVKLVTEQGYSVAEASRSLDVGESLLRSWLSAFQEKGTDAFPATGASAPRRKRSADSRPRTLTSWRSARS